MKLKKTISNNGKMCGFNLIGDNNIEVQIGRSSYQPATFYIKKYIGYAEVLNTAFFHCYNWGQAYQYAKTFFSK